MDEQVWRFCGRWRREENDRFWFWIDEIKMQKMEGSDESNEAGDERRIWCPKMRVSERNEDAILQVMSEWIELVFSNLMWWRVRDVYLIFREFFSPSRSGELKKRVIIPKLKEQKNNMPCEKIRRVESIGSGIGEELEWSPMELRMA